MTSKGDGWTPQTQEQVQPGNPYYSYTDEASTLAASRGFDRKAHIAALESGDEDEIGLTHPFNWLTEAEVEAYPNLDSSGFPDNWAYGQDI